MLCFVFLHLAMFPCLNVKASCDASCFYFLKLFLLEPSPLRNCLASSLQAVDDENNSSAMATSCPMQLNHTLEPKHA